MPSEPSAQRTSGRVRLQAGRADSRAIVAAVPARQRCPRRAELPQRKGGQSAGGRRATRQAAPNRRAMDGYRIRLTILGDLPALTGLLQAVA